MSQRAEYFSFRFDMDNLTDDSGEELMGYQLSSFVHLDLPLTGVALEVSGLRSSMELKCARENDLVLLSVSLGSYLNAPSEAADKLFDTMVNVLVRNPLEIHPALKFATPEKPPEFDEPYTYHILRLTDRAIWRASMITLENLSEFSPIVDRALRWLEERVKERVRLIKQEEQ